MDRLQIENIAGKLPLTGALFRNLARPTPNFWRPFAAKMGLNFGERFTQEMAQNAVPLVVDEVARAPGADMKGRDWGKELEALKAAPLETAFALLPI